MTSVPSMTPDKPTLRSTIRAALAATTPQQRAAWSASINQQLLAHPLLVRARTIFLYAPMPHSSGQPLEVDISAAALHWLSSGRSVALPAAGPVAPVIITDWQADLQPAPRGPLLVPRPGLPAADLARIDAVIVPGLAFTRTAPHRRLGRGGGFYDQFIASLPPRPDLPRGRAVLISPAFDLQLVDAVPTEPHDQPVDTLITPH